MQPFIHQTGITHNSRYALVFDSTVIRGNTILTGWPKPPPARREGSSGLFAMRCIIKPAKRDKERTERFAPLGESFGSLGAGFIFR